MIKISQTPEEYRLRILAEECTELAQAALKLIRAMDYDTPVTVSQARENLIEECADVLVGMKAILSKDQMKGVQSMESKKVARWELRLNDVEIL